MDTRCIIMESHVFSQQAIVISKAFWKTVGFGIQQDEIGVQCRGVDKNHVGKEIRSEEHTSELQSRENLVCRLLLEKKKEREHCHECTRRPPQPERRT